MQQIIVNKLPESYFVTDTYYPSGNVNFMIGEVDLGGSCYGYKAMITKHIQLIAANQEINNLYRGETPINYFIDSNGEEVFKGADIDIALGCEIEGKDYFIYKVSEEK